MSLTYSLAGYTNRSEPEAQILLGVATQFKPHVWVNVHSGMEAMFTPWDHKAEVSIACAIANPLLACVLA